MGKVAKGFIFGLVLYAVALLGPSTTVSACDSSCRQPYHLHANSTCGACTTPGTKYESYVPTNHYVPYTPYGSFYDAMDEGVWLLNTNYINNAEGTEAGYFSGWWPYTQTPVWYGNLQAYGTTQAGYGAGAVSAGSLTGGASVWAYSWNSGRNSEVVQNGNLFWNCNCWAAVPTPRFNSAQGEALAWYTDAYGFPELNNCTPGEQFTMFFQSASNLQFYDWSSMSLQNSPSPPSPYWSSQQSVYQWSNGGGC